MTKPDGSKDVMYLKSQEVCGYIPNASRFSQKWVRVNPPGARFKEYHK